MRSVLKCQALRTLGATPVVADTLDPEQVACAVAEASPEAVIHQLTALSSAGWDGASATRWHC